jgi:hypothetical protein
VRADGRLVSGPSLSCRVAKTDVDLDTDTQAKLSTALTTNAPKPAHRVADGAQLYCGASVLKNTPRFSAWDQVRSNVFKDRIFWLLRMVGSTRPRFRVREIEHRHEAAEPNQINARFLMSPICQTKCVNAVRRDNHLVKD